MLTICMWFFLGYYEFLSWIQPVEPVSILKRFSRPNITLGCFINQGGIFERIVSSITEEFILNSLKLFSMEMQRCLMTFPLKYITLLVEIISYGLSIGPYYRLRKRVTDPCDRWHLVHSRMIFLPHYRRSIYIQIRI